MSELNREFREQGYIVKRQFIMGKELLQLQKETKRFIEEVVPTLPQGDIYYEDKRDILSLKQVQLLQEKDDFFKRLGSSKEVIGLAEECLAAPAKLVNIQYFNKAPGKNQATPPHQDGHFFMIKPQEAVTMWLSLGEADGENGAVCYIPESHLKGMRPHGKTSVLGFSQAILDWGPKDDAAELQMTASEGDILAHHSLTIHRANRNESQRNRRSIGFIFYRQDVEIDEEAHREYQKNLHNTLREKGKI